MGLKAILAPLAGAVLVMVGLVAAPSAVNLGAWSAARAEPIVPGIRPNPRPIPTPRITPRAPPAIIQRQAPGPRFGPNPGIVRPNMAGPNCRSSCGSRCQMVSCSGLNVSQCASARQRCRVSCSTHC